MSKNNLRDDDLRIARWSREAKAKKKYSYKIGFHSTEKEIGLVISVHRKTYILQDENHKTISCGLHSNTDIRDWSQMAVGDKVFFERNKSSHDGLIVDVLPRESKFFRPGPQDRRHKKLVLAANIDTMILFFATRDPDFNSYMLDRYLLRMKVFLSDQVDFLIVINKMDLLDNDSQISPLILFLKENNVEVYFISCKEKKGLEELKKRVENKHSLITGPSGAGKSSFLQEILPEHFIKIAEKNTLYGKGKHTTTHSSLYHFCDDKSGWIIDSPGVREIATWDVSLPDLYHHFMGFDKYTSRCQFRDCQHDKEKNCAIKQAVEEKHIPQFRYDSYLKILHEKERK